MNKKVFIIIHDDLSAIIAKGEVLPRYYNPGDFFDEVHLLMTNSASPDVTVVQKMVGSARLRLYNLPRPSFVGTLGWQPFLFRQWLEKGLCLVREIAPDMLRIHNNFIEGYLAAAVKKALGIPYVVSLHAVWDRDDLIGLKNHIIRRFRVKFERATLRDADAVIAVYKPMLRYAREYGASHVELIYNVVQQQHIRPKQDYALSRPPRLITVNRQGIEKNPEQIIRAIKEIDCHYVIVGDGEYHDYLKSVAARTGTTDKVEFIRAVPNDQLCGMLRDFDVMVSHCDYVGISKTLIEGALAGLPIVVNRHPVEPIPDYDGGWLSLCDNTPEAYRQAILALLSNEDLRTEYGQRSYAHAQEHFNAAVMEEKMVDLYRRVIAIGGK